MNVVGLAALVPPAAVGVAALAALRPSAAADAVAPRRLAVLRSGVFVAVVAVVSVELASPFDAVGRAGFVAAWSVALAGVGAVAWRRRLEHGTRPRLARPPPAVVAVVGAGTILVVLEAVAGVAAEPSNWDSLTYHLARVAHWLDRGDVDIYPTRMAPQIMHPPGAEYLVLHVSALWEGDRLVNLVQWFSGVLAAVAASRVAAQLGARPLAQAIAGLVLATTPMVVMQATTTQNDLVGAGWTAVTVSAVLDDLRRPTRPSALLVGGAVGLAVLTKSTAAVAIVPILLWWAWKRLRVAWRPALQACSVAVAIAAIIAAPHFLRVQSVYGHPLGSPGFRDHHETASKAPADVVVNGLRLAHSLTRSFDEDVNRWTANRVADVADLLSADLQEPRTTAGSHIFPQTGAVHDPDAGPYPLQTLLAMAAVVVAGLGMLGRGAPRAIAACAFVAAVFLAATLRWMPFATRFFLVSIAVSAPLVGLLADRVASTRFGRVAVAAVVGLAALTGFTSALDGDAALRGPGSVLRRDAWATRMRGNPPLGDRMLEAAGIIRAEGVRTVGLEIEADSPEYPWWVLLGDLDLVPVGSSVPDVQGAPVDEVDVLVCTGRYRSCFDVAPAGWRVVGDEELLLAFRPTG